MDPPLKLFTLPDCAPCEDAYRMLQAGIDAGTVEVLTVDPSAAKGTPEAANWNEAQALGQNEFPFVVKDGQVCRIMNNGTIRCPDANE